LISSPYFQLGVTGKDHHSHPGELEFATSSGAVYGNLPVKDKWIMAGISRSEENTLFEIDGLWSGGPYIHEETTTMATGPQVGAKGILTWNHRLQDYDAQYTEKFEGYLGEILLFDGKMSDNRKWRTVAYLLSKWIGYVVYDGSDESHSVYAEGASGETLFTKYESEFVPAYGKDFKYVIIGGAWDDELTGGHEDDILIGNTGDDVLCGKGGKDIFVVDNGDLIVDFYEPDGDKINLVHLFKNAKGDIHHYLNIETDGTETYLLIDEDGDGSGFTDAKITIRHNVYRDLDMPRLWADGFLVTGGIRPHLTVAINQLSDTSIEVTREAATFEICFNESHVPKNLTVVLNETGTATVGEDFILETSIYNEDTETYERVEATDGIVPIQPGPDSLSQKVWVVPIADGKREADETISLIIGAKGEYYDVAHENQANIILKDGKDIVGIQSTRPMAYETGEISGSLSVYRKGSITESLVVQLGIQGTATNGRDYLYLPTEVSIPAGKNAVTIDISPIKDFDTELDEVVEIIVQPKESYVLDDSRSAIVNITDSSIKSGDINGDERITIKDLIIVLQVTTGKAQKTDFFIESEISGDGQIDIQDAVYTLRIISEMK
ncbi:Type 1 secretion, target domain protein, partial [Candidatus Magnetomorum sp. HK-1]